MKNLLFICTGNYYRSKFAEIYFNFLSDVRKSSWSSFSRGVAIDLSNNVGPLSPYAQEMLYSLNVPIPVNIDVAQTLTLADLMKAERVIVLDEEEHRPYMRNLFPEWEERITFWDIKDIQFVQPKISLERLKTQIIQLHNLLAEIK